MTAANDGPEELIGEMASLETLGLQNGGKVEVEVFFKLDVFPAARPGHARLSVRTDG